MKLHRVKFDNFRQFYGDQQIDFAVGERKNVTLVHAENGFGKTTILNAVLWALFNQLTKKFEEPDKILNFQASDEGKHTALVDVEFEFQEKNYLVKRRFDDRADRRDKTDLTAHRIQGGSHIPLTAPETFIASVVPPEMAKYFFFDGEAAEAFSSVTNYKAIGEAIRNILGCALADTAINDLKEVTKQVDRDLGKVPGNDELAGIEKELQQNDQDQVVAVNLKSQLEADIVTLSAQRDEILESLRI